MTIDEKKLAELRELLAKATPRPWRVATTINSTTADDELVAAAVNALPELLDTIDAQREEIERLKETDAESLRVWEREQKRIAALEAELDRWRHGAPIEGDFVCPDSLRATALEVENARLRGSIKHAHGCLLDAGVTMPGDPLAGVSDGIRALEAENAALRDESERHRICAVAGWTVARIVSVANNDAHCIQRADEALNALRKEGK